MGCCGGRRAQASMAVPPRPRPEGPDSGAARRRYEHVYFQYTGGPGMTVIGPATGQRYRFVTPGQAVAVDPQDRRSVAQVPGLRQVAGP